MERLLLYPACLLLASFLLSACTNTIKPHDGTSTSSSPGDKALELTYVYNCENDYNFVARIQGEKVWLFLPNQTIWLPSVPSASGAKFNDKSNTYWSKGQEALLEVDKKIYQHCKNNPAKAIWEHAKLNGVDFRAVGNEPGWHLEIMNQNRIVLTTDYGQSHYIFKAPDPVINKPAGSAKYILQNNQHHAIVVLTRERCQDSMSGESFETTVTVVLDGIRFRGCGKALH